VVNQIVVCRRALEVAVCRMVEKPSAVALWSVGQNRCPELTELLCREFALATLDDQLPSLAHLSSWVVMALSQTPSEREQLGRRGLSAWGQRLAETPKGLAGFLALARQPQQASLTGCLLSKSGIAVPLHSFKIVGPGMHRIWTPEGRTVCPEPPLTPEELERWSRSMGALGQATWYRLRCLRYVLIGVGRTGSLVGTSLARLGAAQVTLIDPDHIERHNLDAMEGVSEDDIGQKKVLVLGAALTAVTGIPPSASPLADSVTTLRALAAVKEADMVISCVDHDGARLASNALASLYAKPLLDIGTGIFGSQQGRQMGADVRLLLPGDRCLLCLGGIANREEAKSFLQSPKDSSRRLQRPWYEERSGSLRSLNQIAAHLGMRLLEDLIGDRIDRSLWLRLEFDSQGIPSLRTLTPSPDPSCLLCGHMGAGDDGLDVVQDLLCMRQGEGQRRQ